MGVNVESMPTVNNSSVGGKMISRMKMVDVSTSKIKRVNFFVAYQNTRYIISAKYERQARKINLRFNEAESSVAGYDLCDPLCFPVALKGRGDTQWMIELTAYDSEQDMFLLKINDTEFWSLPHADIPLDGPQNIKEGEIIFNGKNVMRGPKSYQDWKESLPKQPEVTEVIIDDVNCSSSEVLNSIIDDISQSIDPHEQVGLRSFELRGFRNKQSFEMWSLRQLASKCSNLLSIKIAFLGFSTAHNKSVLMDFCAEACVAS